MEMHTNENIRPSNDDRTLKSLSPNVAGLLCYVAGWISGIVFLVLEQKNRFVRFHALQSIIVFGTLALIASILGHIPVAGPGFSWIIGLTGFVLWILLMIKAYSGEVFKLPWAGDLAERFTNETLHQPVEQPIKAESTTYSASPVQPVAASSRRSARQEDFKTRYYSFSARTGRVVGSSLAIAWSVALFIFFNFFNQYIAYYQPINEGGVIHWQMYSLLTSDFNSWLPILNTTLALSVAGHIVSLSMDRFILRQAVEIILDIFGLATVATLLYFFPFNFDVIPNADAVYWAPIGLSITLVFIAIGFGVGALVKLIRLIVNSAEGKY